MREPILPIFLYLLHMSNFWDDESRGTLTRLIALESIVSQHPVFQSLNAYAIPSFQVHEVPLTYCRLAYTLATHAVQGIFPAMQHLEEVRSSVRRRLSYQLISRTQVLQKTHDPRFDFELKEVSLACIHGLRGTPLPSFRPSSRSLVVMQRWKLTAPTQTHTVHKLHKISPVRTPPSLRIGWRCFWDSRMMSRDCRPVRSDVFPFCGAR